jgi:DNA polymerase-3 subunit gamma/tau
MLLRGLDDVAHAPNPAIAADMVLVRLCHAADLPTPDEALKQVKEEGPPNAREPMPPLPEPRTGSAEPASATATLGEKSAIPADTADRTRAGPAAEDTQSVDPPVRIDSFEDLVRLANDHRDRLAVFALERHVRPTRCEHGRLDITLTEDADPQLPQILTEKLQEWTGMRWIVTVSADAETLSVHEARQRRQVELFESARSDPLVAGVLKAFPGAAIVDVRERDIGEAEPAGQPDPQLTKQSKEN